MSTLALRLQAALLDKQSRDPSASQAELARYCATKGPSVSDWFTGETKSLKAQSLVMAAEYLEVRPRWLLDGAGPMKATGPQWRPPAPALTLPDALPVVLDAMAKLPPARRVSVRAQFEQLAEHPEMRDDALTELLTLLQTAPTKRLNAGA